MISAFVINLDKDTQKWVTFQNAFSQTTTNIHIERFKAVDGKQYRKTLHPNISNWAHYFNTDKTIGCFKSHTMVWKQIVERNLEYAVVFEDDVNPTKNWEERVLSTIRDMSNSPWDIILLGYHSQNITKHSDKTPLLFSMLKFLKIGKESRNIANGIISPVTFGGTHAYLISNEGAKKLLELCKIHNGVAIDLRMAVLHGTGAINVAACVPPIITTYGGSELQWLMNDGVLSVRGCEIKYKHFAILCGLLLVLYVVTWHPVFICGMFLILGMLVFCIYPTL